MRTNQQTKNKNKKIPSGYWDESAVWMKSCPGKGPEEHRLSEFKVAMELPSGWASRHQPATYIVAYGWFRAFSRLILPYKLNLEPNPKMLHYSVYVFKALYQRERGHQRTKAITLLLEPFRKPFELVGIKDTWKTFARRRLGNVERFSHAFPDGSYLNFSLVLKHMLGNLAVGVGRGDGNDYKNVAYISHSSLEKSL